MTCLTKNERIQVHHNYILAVSSLEHKKDLINRLKRSDTHNIPAYEAEMSRHMTLHEDVLERILYILKQDDYYRTLEDLPVIDELTAYNDIRLFPELYDTSTIIERVTAEADLIERQLRRPGMYPQHTNACMPLINQETLEEAHGMANSEISLSLITSITWKIVGMPRMTGQSFSPGSSITIAIWSSLYPSTQGI